MENTVVICLMVLERKQRGPKSVTRLRINSKSKISWIAIKQLADWSALVGGGGISCMLLKEAKDRVEIGGDIPKIQLRAA